MSVSQLHNFQMSLGSAFAKITSLDRHIVTLQLCSLGAVFKVVLSATAFHYVADGTFGSL